MNDESRSGLQMLPAFLVFKKLEIWIEEKKNYLLIDFRGRGGERAKPGWFLSWSKLSVFLKISFGLIIKSNMVIVVHLQVQKEVKKSPVIPSFLLTFQNCSFWPFKNYFI